MSSIQYYGTELEYVCLDEIPSASCEFWNVTMSSIQYYGTELEYRYVYVFMILEIVMLVLFMVVLFSQYSCTGY